MPWGAVDPAWSPDGREIAFSLFGSIWRVPAAGGAAVQISAGDGYDAHPAWSPAGDQIAFVRGNPPAGRLPNVPGVLMVADLKSGRERKIETPAPVSGTLSWAPDGRRIACALRLSDSGALMHEIDVSDGAVRQLQYLMQLFRGGSTWLDASWNSKRNEIYFTGQRTPSGVAQVWSIAPSGPPVIVQMPLTRYRPEDIALLHGISALPDGSGLILSADIVNGKGDYELYRIDRAGGAPQAITKTARDEFSPAVSPDGRWIAHVSNHLGNTDVFVIPAAGGERRHVRIPELKFRRPSAKLRLRVEDERGEPTAVRLYLRASDGRAYCPRGAQIFYYFLEPKGPREGFFLAGGDDTVEVPAGPVRLAALKGPEYEIEEQIVEAAPGGPVEATIRMRRWTNWAQRGWYSGENHYHANYNGSYYQRSADSLRWLEAEDLNAANLIVANSEGAFIHDKEFFRGAVDPLSRPFRLLYYGQEFRNSFPLGHMAFLNIKRQVPPSFTSVAGSPAPYDYPLNTMAAAEARKQGGLVSYVHPTGQGRDVFDTLLGAKEVPIGAALGTVDAIDVLPFGETSYQLWYRLLNAGFRISPGAGTDVFTNWRGINMIPGGARQYVNVTGPFQWERWVERFREGRAFVTNGPLLEFTVDGSAPGTVIPAPEGMPHRARISVETSSRAPLDAIEFLRNGEVFRRLDLPRTGRHHRVEEEVLLDRSSWLAVRVTGPQARGIADYFGGVPKAHSGVVYVHLGGKPVLVREDIELMLNWIDRLWMLLEERNNYGSVRNRTEVMRIFDRARQHYRDKLRQL